MSSFYQNFFSPLNKEWCDYFLYLAVFAFIVLAYIVISALFTIVMGTSKNKGDTLYTMFLTSLPVLITYFQNRLLYSMCSAPMRG